MIHRLLAIALAATILTTSGCVRDSSSEPDAQRTSAAGPQARCHTLPEEDKVIEEEQVRGAWEVITYAVLDRGTFYSRPIDGQATFQADCRTVNVQVTVSWSDPGVPREWRLVVLGCAADPDAGPAGTSPLVWDLRPDELRPGECDPEVDLVDRTAGANANQRIEYEAVVTRWAEPSAEDGATALWLADKK